MADITWAQVVAFAAELVDVDIDAQDDILAHVNQALDAATFGGVNSPTFKLARIYLAAHMGSVTVRGADGATGAVTSESVGGISRSYSVASEGAATSSGGIGYSSTSYGQAYLELVGTSLAPLPLLG